MWKCRSIRPGRMVRPDRSRVSVLAGPATASRGPTAVRRSPWMTTRPFSIGAAPVPSMTRTLSRTSVGGSSRGAARTGSIPVTAAAAMTQRKEWRTSRIVVCRGLMKLKMATRSVVCGVALIWALRVVAAAPETAVRVWEDSLELPTYAEGPPNPNPPFDLFSFTRFNYPYTLRDALTDRRAVQQWRGHHPQNQDPRVPRRPRPHWHLLCRL